MTGCKGFTTYISGIKDDYRYGKNRDHATDISEITIELSKESYIKKLDHIQQMAKETMVMLVQSVEAFVNKDMDKARTVIVHDDVVDDLFNKVKAELIAMIHEDVNAGEQASDLLMVAKYFERIGIMRLTYQNGLYSL